MGSKGKIKTLKPGLVTFDELGLKNDQQQSCGKKSQVKMLL